MRIPHNINENTQKTYQTSPESLELVGESSRNIKSDDFQWDKNACPSLEDCTVQAIKKYFEQKPLLNELPCADRLHLLEILPIDLPLELIIPLIDDEFYWQRRYTGTYGLVTRSKPEDWTWKSLYIERHCQQLVEEAQPQYNDENEYDEILNLCSPYVKRLFVTQLQCWKPPLTMEKEDIPEEYPIDHINFAPIFKKLHYIEEFEVIFGMNNVGENFIWNMYKVSVPDCQRLGKALFDLKYLRTIKIHRSALDYKHCQALIHGLIKIKELVELDLSHCEVKDAGAMCIAYYLKDPNTSLHTLRLVNNGIGQIGAEAIGFAMCSGNCDNLTILDLRLNPLGTEGTMGILRAVVRCPAPKELSLAACLFGDDTPIKIGQMIKLDDHIKKLDISSNWFGIEGGKCIIEAIEKNTILEWLDMRETDISEEQRATINSLLLRNRSLNDISESDCERKGKEEENRAPEQNKDNK